MTVGETIPTSPTQMPFLVGERVRVSVPVDRLKTMQEGHGGWNQKMAEVITCDLLYNSFWNSEK